MATLEEKQQLVQDALDFISDRVDNGPDFGEVILNLFCFVMQDMDMTLHETMSMVMDYYKRNPMPTNADH